MLVKAEERKSDEGKGERDTVSCEQRRPRRHFDLDASQRGQRRVDLPHHHPPATRNGEFQTRRMEQRIAPCTTDGADSNGRDRCARRIEQMHIEREFCVENGLAGCRVLQQYAEFGRARPKRPGGGEQTDSPRVSNRAPHHHARVRAGRGRAEQRHHKAPQASCCQEHHAPQVPRICMG